MCRRQDLGWFFFVFKEKIRRRGLCDLWWPPAWQFGPLATLWRHGTALLSERINHNSNTQSSSPAGLYEQWKFQPRKKKSKRVRRRCCCCFFSSFVCSFSTAADTVLRVYFILIPLIFKQLIAPSSLTVFLPAFLPSFLPSIFDSVKY